MKRKVTKKIEIEDLAIMVQKGFSEQGKRFDGLEEKFEGLDGRIENLEKSGFEVKLQLESINDRLTGIEKILGPLVLVVDVMKNNWRDHEMRIAKIERRLQVK